MALSGSIVWEVRTGGSDLNGGGFKTGASGTDYSLQDAAQKSGSDLNVHASDATKVQPVAAGVASADVGNVVFVRGQNYLNCSGSSGQFVRTNDSAALSITGDIDLRAKVALTDWTPASAMGLVGKWHGPGVAQAYLLTVEADGTLKLYTSTTGGNDVTGTSTVPTGIADGAVKWVRATLDVDDGAGNRVYNFYTSDDGSTWTQLGATVTTAGTTTIFDSNQELEVGSWQDGASGRLIGKVYEAQVRNGIDGTVVASPVFANQAAATTVFADAQGNTWTLDGTQGTLVAGPIVTGLYEITAQDGTYWTLDRAAGTTGSTGGTYTMGGAFASPGKAGNVATVSGHKIFLKYSATPYDVTTTTPGTAGPVQISVTTDTFVALIGYDTTRSSFNTDANRPTIRATVGSITLVSAGASHSRPHAMNVILDTNGQASVIGFANSGFNCPLVWRCKTVGCATGFNAVGAVNCWASGGTTGFSLAGSLNSGYAIGCVASDCSGFGFNCERLSAVGCIAIDCGNGFQLAGSNQAGAATNCTAYSCTTDGFVSAANAYGPNYTNCLAYGNGRYGFNLTGRPHASRLVNCAGGSNTSGNTAAVDDSTVQVLNFTTLTADPFTNAAGGDFSLNNTAGGGAALRAAGFPGVFPNGTTTGYVDIGAAQHEDAGGGAPVFFRRGGLVCKT